MKRSAVAAALAFLIIASALACASAAEQGKWPGVDEAVVKKFAGDAGRQASEPLFGMEGDMVLLAFLIAGAVGGFAGGYYFRSLFPPRGKDEKVV